MKYQVIKEYNDAPSNPIQICIGEKLMIIKETEPSGEWPNWIYCQGIDKEGWIPKQLLSISGTEAVSTDNYSAREFNLSIGEILISNHELNGWIWGHKEKSPDDLALAWAPLNYLKKL